MKTIRANIHGLADELRGKYVICTVIDGELWYYGQDDDLGKVKKICKDRLMNRCYFETIEEDEA